MDVGCASNYTRGVLAIKMMWSSMLLYVRAGNKPRMKRPNENCVVIIIIIGGFKLGCHWQTVTIHAKIVNNKNEINRI